MRELVGKDLWKIKADLKVISINLSVNQQGELVMGRGVAREAAERYPSLPKSLGTLVKDIDAVYGADPLTVIHPRSHPQLQDFPSKLAAFVVKPARHGEHAGWECGHRRKEPLCRLLVLRRITMAIPTLIWLADELKAEKVLIPRLGCGFGGLDWRVVRPILEDCLDNRFVVCHK